MAGPGNDIVCIEVSLAWYLVHMFTEIYFSQKFSDHLYTMIHCDSTCSCVLPALSRTILHVTSVRAYVLRKAMNAFTVLP
jgi:hypothetical protein